MSGLTEAIDSVQRELVREFLESLPAIDKIWGVKEARCTDVGGHVPLRCTKKENHEGDHVAHGLFAICDRWPR